MMYLLGAIVFLLGLTYALCKSSSMADREMKEMDDDNEYSQ